MYPHKLYVVSVASSRDEDGYVNSTEGNEIFVGNCRLETQGKASQMTEKDGTQTYVSATIYAQRVDGCVCSGNLICVRDAYGNQLIRKPVVNCSITQLHTRIWV